MLITVNSQAVYELIQSVVVVVVVVVIVVIVVVVVVVVSSIANDKLTRIADKHRNNSRPNATILQQVEIIIKKA